MVKAIPDGYHSATPYLIVDGAARALDFYKRAFGAKELLRIPAPGDRVGHAEIKVGDSVIMLADKSTRDRRAGPPAY
jgi:PhnB protein